MKKSTLKSAAINQSIYQFPYKIIHKSVLNNQKSDYHVQSKPLKSHQTEKLIDENQPKIQLSDELNKNDSHLSESKPIITEFKPLIFKTKIKQEDKIFTPDDDLYYIYFLEKNYSERNIQLKNTELFGIKNINDLQRGYKLNNIDPNYYTFFGFVQSIDCIFSISILSKKDEIIKSSIKRVDNDEYSSENDDDELIEMKREETNLNRSNELKTNEVKSKIEKSEKNENLLGQKSNYDEINAQFYYRPASIGSTQNSKKNK